MKNLLYIFSLFYSTFIFGHGMDKLGPNKGYITMPSTYHVELVPKNSKMVHVYLLDIAFKNPLTQKSKVLLQHKDHHSTNALCKPKKNYFECTFKDDVSFDKGQLIVSSTRNQIEGKDAVYELPLKLEKTKESSPVQKRLDNSHGMHH